MKRILLILGVGSALLLAPSCAKKEATDPAAANAGAPADQAAGPRAVVHLTDGSKLAGSIVASSQTDMTVAGDDGIERKIPLTQIASVEYGAPKSQPAPQTKSPQTQFQTQSSQIAAGSPAAPQPLAAVRTYELPAGSQVSVRVNETIDSATAAEGQAFDAQVTRNAKDAAGNVVIPKGSGARIVIKSASKGSRFRGASDLVLDFQTVVINGTPFRIDAADVGQKGRAGIGANKRTAEMTGGGAALGAIIGAIAGGGKGAAIGAGAGAGAGALTQVLTKGGSIKVPAESVLTFSLDRPLKVYAAQ
jgi:hypothetical protein